MRKIWRRSDIDESKEYALLLFDDGAGTRDFEICERQLIPEKSRNQHCVFFTDAVPINLALNGDILGIAEHVRLSTGEPFYFNSKGIWLTKGEFDDLAKGKTDIEWIRGSAPRLPPK